MRIGDRSIGREHSPYIIAEIGVNHDGSCERALQLVRAAAKAGADAAKFQYFETDRLMSNAAKLAAYQRAAGESDPVSMLRRLELPIEDLAKCVTLAHELGIHAIVTVFSTELVRSADLLAWDAYKTASPDLIHKPLLLALSATGKPMILSTGAAEIDELRRTLGWLPHMSDKLAVLQCVSSYPTPLAEAAIGAMRSIARAHLGPVGYSDHTPEVATGGIAVAAGACVLEKHLTHDRSAKGPDHSASLDPAQFAEYVRIARGAHGAMRSEAKVVTPIEREVRRLSRQSIVAKRGIKAGQTIEMADLTIKRPGTGLEPAMLPAVVGASALRDLEADAPLMEGDVRLVMPTNRSNGTDGALLARVWKLCVVTGSRAEFGLLRPVIRAITQRSDLRLQVVVAGSHLIEPARTIDEVRAEFGVDAEVAMQTDAAVLATASDLVGGGSGDGRVRDAAAVGAGIASFTKVFSELKQDWVMVLGDRIEAFAAASAAALSGIAVAHIHGGDRAEGVSDESMRHAISKLAHLHFAASEQSAERLKAMGESAERVVQSGSPAIDGLIDVVPLSVDGAREAGLISDKAGAQLPRSVVLLHPSGMSRERERALAEALFEQIEQHAPKPILALMPNHDADREVIAEQLRRRAADGWMIREHLPRSVFVSLLRTLSGEARQVGEVRKQGGATTNPRGVMIGNSSAGLIEAAALGVPVLNVGPRQNGRERAGSVVDLSEAEIPTLREKLREALARPRSAEHPYGDGHAGARIAAAIAERSNEMDPASVLRKCNSY